MNSDDPSRKHFELSVKKLQTGNARPHRHRFFEFIYILQGKGKHLINGNLHDYEKGSLFLLNTHDLHAFRTDSPTEVCIIDFTGGFFAFIQSDKKQLYQSDGFFEQMDYIFHNQDRLMGNIITKKEDKLFIESLIERLLIEKESGTYGSENMGRNIVFLLMLLVSRYIHEHSLFPGKTERAKKVIRDIINFVHQNIYNKEAIEIEHIARYFCKSRDHISLYFKRQTGITLKSYIISYKIELIKTRLLYSDLPISSIASELNFVDASHLNKFFKEKLGITANTFRKQNREV